MDLNKKLPARAHQTQDQTCPGLAWQPQGKMREHMKAMALWEVLGEPRVENPPMLMLLPLAVPQSGSRGIAVRLSKWQVREFWKGQRVVLKVFLKGN
eukprot:5034844-Amphidinium_carterae.1